MGTNDQGNLKLTYQTLPFSFNFIKPKEHSPITDSIYADMVCLKSTKNSLKGCNAEVSLKTDIFSL